MHCFVSNELQIANAQCVMDNASTFVKDQIMQAISNSAVAGRFSEMLTDLGGISSERVYRDPEPGRATIGDLLQKNKTGAMCELIDGTLVEKARGWTESLKVIKYRAMHSNRIRR